MRRFLFLLALAIAVPLRAMAADNPPKLEPLPEVPPPPNTLDGEVSAEPQITIIKKGSDTIEEYRVNNELYMMKVTPFHGVPYYLLKEDQEGGWSRMEGPNPRISVPKWVLFRF
ncbi:MAG: DUF2782 domain-containing protein [Methylophilaceae bacterium]|nr:DUF2782 domain-containing protein [Methylophilaceae bacterium]